MEKGALLLVFLLLAVVAFAVVTPQITDSDEETSEFCRPDMVPIPYHVPPNQEQDKPT